MTYDYQEAPTSQLAQETMLRARDVWKITDDAHKMCAVAYLLMAVGIISSIIAHALFELLPWPLLICIPGIVLWGISIKECREFTEEMKARSLELKKRNSGGV